MIMNLPMGEVENFINVVRQISKNKRPIDFFPTLS